MSSTTQMMNNTTEVEYISIYDRPKRGKGRPKTCTLTEEEKNNVKGISRKNIIKTILNMYVYRKEYG